MGGPARRITRRPTTHVNAPFTRCGASAVAYRVVLRGKRYDAEKNGRIILESAELEAVQRCVEASVERSRKYRARHKELRRH